MVHKITDGIPCVHERTDFCYLCGEAVTQDYPHDEVNHPGINHFPEGVFQKCRVILAKDREEEREQLRHMRRNRIRNAQRARRGRRDQQAEGEMGEDGRQVATDVEWTGDVLPAAVQDMNQTDPTTGIQLVIKSNTPYQHILQHTLSSHPINPLSYILYTPYQPTLSHPLHTLSTYPLAPSIHPINPPSHILYTPYPPTLWHPLTLPSHPTLGALHGRRSTKLSPARCRRSGGGQRYSATRTR